MGSMEVEPIVSMPSDWNLNDSEAVLYTDPAKIYNEWDYLRSKCPVAHVDHHRGYWILTK